MKEVLHPNFLKFWLFCRYFSDRRRQLPNFTDSYRILSTATVCLWWPATQDWELGCQGPTDEAVQRTRV